MTDQTTPASRPTVPWKLIAAGVVLGCVALWPQGSWNAAVFSVGGLIAVSPLVIPGILIAAWIIASGADSHVAAVFRARPGRAIWAAAAIGAITPVCGVTVLPLMAGLLAAGVPLAPIMAFWLSSPVTDPAMLATTAATLGLSFAVGKTVAAFFLGVFGGAATSLFGQRPWALNALRDNPVTGGLSGCGCAPQGFDPYVWRDADRRSRFTAQARATTRLILICLLPAFAAEYALNATLQPEALTVYVGEESWWAIPLAVIVGAPAYRRLCRAAAHPRLAGPWHVPRGCNGISRLGWCGQHLGGFGDLSGAAHQALSALSRACGDRLSHRRLCV